MSRKVAQFLSWLIIAIVVVSVPARVQAADPLDPLNSERIGYQAFHKHTKAHIQGVEDIFAYMWKQRSGQLFRNLTPEQLKAVEAYAKALVDKHDISKISLGFNRDHGSVTIIEQIDGKEVRRQARVLDEFKRLDDLLNEQRRLRLRTPKHYGTISEMLTEVAGSEAGTELGKIQQQLTNFLNAIDDREVAQIASRFPHVTDSHKQLVKGMVSVADLNHRALGSGTVMVRAEGSFATMSFQEFGKVLSSTPDFLRGQKSLGKPFPGGVGQVSDEFWETFIGIADAMEKEPEVLRRVGKTSIPGRLITTIERQPQAILFHQNKLYTISQAEAQSLINAASKEARDTVIAGFQLGERLECGVVGKDMLQCGSNQLARIQVLDRGIGVLQTGGRTTSRWLRLRSMLSSGGKAVGWVATPILTTASLSMDADAANRVQLDIPCEGLVRFMPSVQDRLPRELNTTIILLGAVTGVYGVDDYAEQHREAYLWQRDVAVDNKDIYKKAKAITLKQYDPVAELDFDGLRPIFIFENPSPHCRYSASRDPFDSLKSLFPQPPKARLVGFQPPANAAEYIENRLDVRPADMPFVAPDGFHLKARRDQRPTVQFNVTGHEINCTYPNAFLIKNYRVTEISYGIQKNDNQKQVIFFQYKVGGNSWTPGTLSVTEGEVGKHDLQGLTWETFIGPLLNARTGTQIPSLHIRVLVTFYSGAFGGDWEVNYCSPGKYNN